MFIFYFCQLICFNYQTLFNTHREIWTSIVCRMVFVNEPGLAQFITFNGVRLFTAYKEYAVSS